MVLCLADGSWRYGQEIQGAVSLTIMPWLEFCFSGYTFIQNGQEVEWGGWSWYNSDEGSLDIFSFAVYPLFIGVSVGLAFDIVTFCDDLDPIWY